MTSTMAPAVDSYIGRFADEPLVLGSEPSHAPAYQAVGRQGAAPLSILVEDVATARLLAHRSPARSAAALVFGDVGHPLVSGYHLLADRVASYLPAAWSALQGADVIAADAPTAAALMLAGLDRPVRILPAPRIKMRSRIERAASLNVAVLGATTSWRSRLAARALLAAHARCPLGSDMRVHLDADPRSSAPEGWEGLPRLGLGDPIDLALFIDSGGFATQLKRLRHLHEGGTQILTSGMGSYAGAPGDGGLQVGPDTLFDSLRAVVAAALKGRE